MGQEEADKSREDFESKKQQKKKEHWNQRKGRSMDLT